MDDTRFANIMKAVSVAPESELPISMGVMMGLFCSGELTSHQKCFLAAILVNVEDSFQLESTLLDLLDDIPEDLTDEEVKMVSDLLEAMNAEKNGGLN